MSINNITLVGRLVRDPELTYIQGSGTAVAKFTIAVNRDYKDKEGNYPVDFIPVEIIGKPAEYTSNYIDKGKLVAVQGAIRVDRYETQGGEKRTFTKVSGRNIQLLEKQKNDSEKYNVGAEFKETVEDDDVPF